MAVSVARVWAFTTLLVIGTVHLPGRKAGMGAPFPAALDTVKPKPGAKQNPKPGPAGRISNGVNLQPSYYANGNVDLGWGEMKKYPKIKSVRIEIEPDQVENAKRWIREASASGYSVIATYHKTMVLGSNNPSDLQDAAIWWQRHYAQLQASGSFTINLMNEWGNHNISAKEYALAYNNAIATVRSVYKGKIIIDVPGWGQETYVAANAVKGTASEGVKIADTAIALSVHIYPGAMVQQRINAYYVKSPGGWMNAADLDYLAGCGRTCLVGEFGSGTAGGAEWSALVDHARSLGWPVLGWAWNGDGGEMNMVSPQFQMLQPGKPFNYIRTEYFDSVYQKL